jgi:hypothetical protein
VLHGDVPHRDFYANYGPGQFYVLAGLFRAFGASILVERAWDTLVRAGIVVLVFALVGQAAPRRQAVLAAAVSLVWLAWFGSYGYPVFPALTAALASVALLAPAIGCPAALWRVATAGFCAGIVLLFRYDVGIAVAATHAALLAGGGWFIAAGRTSKLLGIARSLAALGAGFAVVALPLAAAVLVAGALPDLVFDVVSFPASAYVSTRTLPFPGLADLGINIMKTAVYLPPLLAVAAVPALLAAWRHDSARLRARPSRLLVALLTLTAVFFAKGLVRVSPIHMAMAIVAALALTGVAAQRVPGRGPAGLAVLAVSLLAAGALTLLALGVDLFRAGQNIAWARSAAAWHLPADAAQAAAGSCRMPDGLARLACLRATPDDIATIRYVQTRTAADAPVFVGLSHHDRIVVNDVLLYFLLDRPAATKWHHFDPGLQTSAPIQREMVAELQRARPPYVVLDSTWDAIREPNASARSSGVTVLDDYLASAYAPAAAFGPHRILRAVAAPP